MTQPLQPSHLMNCETCKSQGANALCGSPATPEERNGLVFTGKTVASVAGMAGTTLPKQKGWTNTKSCSGFPVGKAFRFSGRKGMPLVNVILLFVLFWIGVGTQWVKGKDKGIAAALGYSGVCVIIVVSIRVYAYFLGGGFPQSSQLVATVQQG